MNIYIGDDITIGETKYFVTGVHEHPDGSFTLEFTDSEPLKWFFHPSTGHVIPRNTMTENEPPSDWMEVTPEYADYLTNKPDGDAVLKVPQKGDAIWCDYGKGNEWDTAASDWTEHSDIAKCMRWCKPKQPKAGWRVYPVIHDFLGYGIMFNGKFWNLDACANSPEPIGLFGGVQFEGQHGDGWHMTPCFIDSLGGTYEFSENDDKPAVPIRARFWQEVK